MTTTLADYRDRIYDVMAFQDVVPVGEALLTQALFTTDSGGTICTGIQKLAQQFVIEFLTEEGSDPYELDRGTHFMISALRGEFLSEADIFTGFALAKSKIQRRFNLIESDIVDLNSEERFQDAELKQIVLTEEAAQLFITITSAAETARQVIVPIPTLVL